MIIYNNLNEHFMTLPIYMHSLSSHHIQENVYRPQGINFAHVFVVVKGEGVLNCCNKSYELTKGCGFFLDADVPHSYESRNNLITAYAGFIGNGIEEIKKYYNNEKFVFGDNLHTSKYITIFKEIEAEYFNRKRQPVISSLIYSGFVSFMEEVSYTELTPIEKIGLYIEKNFAQPITLSEIAHQYKFSESKLHKDFKAHFGCSVFEHILNLRLNYAQNYIRMNQTAKTKDIALMCGFTDISYFCHSYKKKFGTSPSKDKYSV